MRRLVLGTAGHIDHGKTTLVRALTGTDTDRLPEEKKRGITIDLGFARLPVDEGTELSIVDVPGHEGFIRNMLAGATGIDLVLLVVAADEGVMPQTREHLAIVDLLGVRGGVVALTKTDTVEPEWLELVQEELRESLAGTPFADAPVVPVSATTGDGLDALRETLARAAAAAAGRGDQDLFRLPVDRVFTVRGTGTVVTGTVWSGRLARDATVRVLPGGRTVRVRGVHAHGAEVDEIRAGMRAALALAGVDRDEIARGATLVAGEGWQETSIVTARIRVLGSADRPLRTRQRVRFHLGTAEVLGRVAVLEASREIEPGETGWAQIRLEAPALARAGDRFVLRSYSPVTTIAGGVVAEPGAGKRKRLEAGVRASLLRILEGAPAEALAARVGLAGWQGLPSALRAVHTPHPPAVVDASLAGLAGDPVAAVGDRLFAGDVVAAARDAVAGAAAAFHAREPLRLGIERSELRRALPPAAAPALADAAIDALLAAGRLRTVAGGLVAEAAFEPALSQAASALRGRVLEILGDGLAPPTLPEWPAEVAARGELRDLLRLLEHRGEVVAVSQELYLAPAAVRAAEDALRAALAGAAEGLTASELRDALGVTRKYLIPILEYFDRSGVTVRAGDRRKLAGG